MRSIPEMQHADQAIIDAAARLNRDDVDELARVLLEEFGGPVGDEGACGMAIRVLREQRATIEAGRKISASL